VARSAHRLLPHVGGVRMSLLIIPLVVAFYATVFALPSR